MNAAMVAFAFIGMVVTAIVIITLISWLMVFIDNLGTTGKSPENYEIKRDKSSLLGGSK